MSTCSVYANDSNYKLLAIYKSLKTTYNLDIYADCIYLKYRTGHVFIFIYGTMVCWELSNQECSEILKILLPFLTSPSEKIYSEYYNIEYSDNIKIFDNTIFLNNTDKNNITSDMLAISHGIAQSEKLGLFEYKIDDLISEIQPLYQYLGKYGKIALSRNKISKKIGQLFSVRSYINLHMSILDTPDFFWENEKLEPTYQKAIHYLDLKPRTDALNSRMSIIQELYEVLHNELQTMHSHRLEWIIIILILIEVILSLWH